MKQIGFQLLKATELTYGYITYKFLVRLYNHGGLHSEVSYLIINHSRLPLFLIPSTHIPNRLYHEIRQLLAMSSITWNIYQQHLRITTCIYQLFIRLKEEPSLMISDRQKQI